MSKGAEGFLFAVVGLVLISIGLYLIHPGIAIAFNGAVCMSYGYRVLRQS